MVSHFDIAFLVSFAVQLSLTCSNFEGRADSAEQAVPVQPETRFADDEILRATLFSGW